MDIKSGFDLFNTNKVKRVKYRFVVLRDDSFKEVASVKLTKRNMVILSSTIFVSLVFITAMLIIYTPLKYYIPGYQGDFGYRSKILKLEYATDSIMTAMSANNMKIQNINNLLTGSFDSTYNKKAVKSLVKTDTINLFSITPEDAALREEIKSMQGTSLKYVDKKSSNQNTDESIYNLYFFPPIQGTISAAYDVKQNRFGTDISAPANEPVKACLDGTIIASGWTIDGGYELTIQHANNIISIYKHNSKLLKKTGNFVKAGEAISIIGGGNGNASGSLLHFELWKNGISYNPTDFIKF